VNSGSSLLQRLIQVNLRVSPSGDLNLLKTRGIEQEIRCHDH
jgi:hypothetical protein